MHVRIVCLRGLVLVVRVAHQVAVDLDRLRAVALLCIELTSVNPMANIDRLDEESSLLIVAVMAMSMMRPCSSLLANDCLTRRIEAKVSLGHQLLVEGGIDTAAVEILWRVSNELNISSAARVSHVRGTSASALEKLGENRFLLLVHVAVTLSACRMNAETLALDRVIELALALLSGSIVSSMLT